MYTLHGALEVSPRMSTIAGMYYMRAAGTPGQDIQPPGE